jgi:REP element-mobilizing transposase RayT
MSFPARPSRPEGFPYDQPGPAYHCRLACDKRHLYLADPTVAAIVVEALRFRHGRSAEILAYCAMPDHLHLLVRLIVEGAGLPRWIADLKRWTARQAKEDARRELAWQANFHEHVVRRDEALTAVARYILENPVRSGLAAHWRDYRWCGSLAWQIDE